MEAPVRYARSPGGDSIAFQVLGRGGVDLLFVPGFVSNLERFWEEPAIAHFYERLAAFSRLILFDKRGTGLSDPLDGPQPLEERAEDMRAVLDAAGSERAALVGVSEGSSMAAGFAAGHPDRVSALVLCGSIMGVAPEEHPAPAKWERATSRFRRALDSWGDGGTLALVAPGMDVPPDRAGALERSGASPRMAQETVGMWLELDIRDILPAISVPTLVIHRSDEIFPVEAARELASQIPGARLVELPGADHAPWSGDVEAYVGEIEEMITGVREHSRSDRVLATVLVTDLVGSTERATELGDARWRRLMARHDELTRAQLRRFEGREVKHTGDGFLVTFDGPARAILALPKDEPSLLDAEHDVGIHAFEAESEASIRNLDLLSRVRLDLVSNNGGLCGVRLSHQIVVSRLEKSTDCTGLVVSTRGPVARLPETFKSVRLRT